MKYNKVYIEKDALMRHEDFDTWYEDGTVFYHFTSKNNWDREKDVVSAYREGAKQPSGIIKADHRCLNYLITCERYEYIMHSYVIERHYYIEGMLWDLYGSYYDPPFDLLVETKTRYDKKDVHVKERLFKGHGLCYEIHVPDLEKLRVAVLAVVAIGLKETWKGLSEGEDVRGNTWLQRLKDRVFENKGLTYQQIKQLELEGSPLVEIIRPEGRPMDNV